MLIGAVGLALRDANQLSNLLFPIIQLLAGTMYPVALMPDWIRLPAECLPFGYALQAIADSVLHHESLADLTADLCRSPASPSCCLSSESPHSEGSSAAHAPAECSNWSDHPPVVRHHRPGTTLS